MAAPPGFVDNSFRISTVVHNRRKGTATLAVVVPGSGELTLRGSAYRRRQASGAAQVLLPVVPKAAQRRALRRKGALRLRLTVTFAPSGGEASSRTFPLRLSRVPGRR